MALEVQTQRETGSDVFQLMQYNRHGSSGHVSFGGFYWYQKSCPTCHTALHDVCIFHVACSSTIQPSTRPLVGTSCQKPTTTHLITGLMAPEHAGIDLH